MAAGPPPTAAAAGEREGGGEGERDLALARSILAQRLSYLSESKLMGLARACRQAEAQAVPGLFIEAGCALGGSSILIARLKAAARELRVYDVFGMIPSPTAADGDDVQARYKTIASGRSKGIGGDRYYGYVDNLYEQVRRNLRAFDIDEQRDRVALIQGLVSDTLALDGPVALAHIDVDWYESVKVCLERIVPRLSVGGILVLDDYHFWSGCRRATDEFFREGADAFAWDDSAGSRIGIRRRAA